MSETEEDPRPINLEVARADLEQLWQNLGIVDGGDELGPMMPFTIEYRNAKGKTVSEEVFLTLQPEMPRLAKCRSRAREFAKKMELDPSFNGEDAAFVKALEKMAILALVVRVKADDADFQKAILKRKKDDPQPVGEYPLRFTGLEDVYLSYRNQDVIARVWSAYDNWLAMNDPRYGELSAEQVWQLIDEVAKKGPVAPLAGIDGPAQIALLVRMAREALLSPNAPSSTPPPST